MGKDNAIDHGVFKKTQNITKDISFLCIERLYLNRQVYCPESSNGLVCPLPGCSWERLGKAREAPLYQVLEVPEEKRGERDEDDQ